MSDNYRREVSKLKRRVGIGNEPQAFCPTCGQRLTRAAAAAVNERQNETAAAARQGLIDYVEAVAERQQHARARKERQAEQEAKLHDVAKTPRERARHAPAGVEEVEGVDLREVETERPLWERAVEDDPVLKVLKMRRAAREAERQQGAADKARPTVTNNDEGGEE